MLIKSLRQKKCISQEQLADETGLSLRTIQRIESGQKVSDSSLNVLAEYFHIDADVLGSEVSKLVDVSDANSLALLARLSNHQAGQLIILIVTFFIFVSQWLGYYSSFNDSLSDPSLATILLYISQIGAAAAVLTYVFSRSKITFVKSYYITACSFLIFGIALDLWIDANYGEDSAPLVFPVFYTLMFLTLCVIHVLQLALSLQSESALVIGLHSKFGRETVYAGTTTRTRAD